MSRQCSPRRERVPTGSRSTVAGMAVVALAWAMMSCGSPTDGPPPVAKVTVTSPVTNLVIGETTQLAVKLADKDGNTLTNRSISWKSSNDAFATVSSNGLVSGEGAGSVTITATSEGQSGTAALIVRVDACQEALPITVGQSVNGRLSLVDCELDDEKLADRYALTLDARTPLQIDMFSVEIDSYLIITTPTGSSVAFNDDGAGRPNARIDTTLAAGNYIIWASSFNANETGAYTLAVGSTAVSQCAISGQIAIGQSVSNELAATDCLLGDGTYADGWQFTLSTTTGVVADLRSTAFDAFVLITDAQGKRLGYNDDRAPGNTNSLLEITLEPGSYYVWANSFYSGQTGAYTLALSSDACETALPLALGETKNGELLTEDCALDDGSFSDRWSLGLVAPTTVRLDLASAAFDPYLVVTNTAGDIVATDDDGGDDDDARVEVTLPAGSFVVWANTYAAGQTGAYSISANAAPAAALNLRIDGAHITQATQRFAGTVPLVASRRAVMRVFGRANVANTAAASVRVRLYHGGALHRTLTMPASASVPTVLGEGTLGLSWNVALDTGDVKPGLSIDAEIDPTGAVAESDETDNVYPATGLPKPIDVREVPRFDLTLVPIRQSTNGLVGNVTQANSEDYVGMTRQVHPLDSIDVAVRAVYTTTLPPLQSDGGSWTQLLGELDLLRLNENPSRSYLGVVKVSYGSGVAGIGYLGGRATALVWDKPATLARFSAHELGHNFGRMHSPCGGPAGVDPDYPYENASIGVIGYDTRSDTLIPRTAADIMSYCPTQWVSDYTFEGVLSFRTPAPSPVVATQAAQPVMLVWGNVDGGKVTLEPAFQITARPSMPNKRGPWVLVARDADGAVLFSHSFDMTEVADVPRPGAAFSFALPIDSQVADRVHSLRLTGPAGQAERVGRARVAPGTVGRERSTDRITMRWDRNAFPAALLRDTRTGRILSIVRNGQLSVTPEPGLELVLSDGVRTIRERVDEQ